MTGFINGYKGVNKQGLQYEVIDDRLAKQTKVRFDCDGAEVVTTRSYLRKGLPAHPTHGKPQTGDLYKDRKGNVIELLSNEGEGYWGIKWHKDAVETVRSLSAIKQGQVKHPLDNKVEAGQTWKTTSGFDIKILKYNSAVDVVVQFEDGSLVSTTAAAIRLGNVGHPTSCFTIGHKFKTNSGWEGEVLEYLSCYKVLVKWQDGSESWQEASDIKKGSIKPLYQPSVAGVGYFGGGRFSSGLLCEGETPPSEVYQYWVRMLNRCYNQKELLKSRGKSYVHTKVCEEWFCFQNFAEWAMSQPNWNMKYELDKDLLGTGFEYSAKNCTFLPQSVNSFLSEVTERPAHNLPLGVQYIKPATTGSKVGYVARCHSENGREYLGYFDDPMSAYYRYKEVKEAYGRKLAEKYKDGLSPEAYNKLSNYVLETIYPISNQSVGVQVDSSKSVL